MFAGFLHKSCSEKRKISTKILAMETPLSHFTKNMSTSRVFSGKFRKIFQNSSFIGCLWGQLLTLDVSLVYITNTGNGFSVFLFQLKSATFVTHVVAKKLIL